MCTSGLNRKKIDLYPDDELLLLQAASYAFIFTFEHLFDE